MRMLTRMMTLMALMTLTACDVSDHRVDARKERGDRLYREAMDDYRAGRLDSAVKGLDKTLCRDPGNASARFQLACLLQDVKHDVPGAYCAFREFLRLDPDGDKAAIARDRLALCEKELAKALAVAHGVAGAAGLARELEVARKELDSAMARVAAMEKELAGLREKNESIAADRERLLSIVKGEDGVVRGPSVKEAKDLLDEDGEVDRISSSADAALLRTDDADAANGGSALLPKRPAGSANARSAAKADSVDAAGEEPKSVMPHPKSYVVVEGDTLYGIAKRFYGRLSAWKAIKNANRALISADNRLRVGDTLVLP